MAIVLQQDLDTVEDWAADTQAAVSPPSSIPMPGPHLLPTVQVQQEPSTAPTALPPIPPTPAPGSQAAASAQPQSTMQVPATRAPARARALEPPPKPQRPKIKIRMTARAKLAMASGRPASVHPAAAKPGPAAGAGPGSAVLDADRAQEDAEAGRLGGIGQGVPETVRPQQADESAAGGMDSVWAAIIRQVCIVLGSCARLRGMPLGLCVKLSVYHAARLVNIG